MVSLYTTQLPSAGADDINETSALTIGTKFYVTVDNVLCTGLRFFGPKTISGTFEGRLFQQTSADAGSATGSLKANRSFFSVTPEIWNPLDFTSAFTLLKNTIYCMAVATSIGRYTALLNGFNTSSISNAGITGPRTNTNPVGSGNVYNGVFGSGLTGFPNQTFNGHAYLVDPVVVFPFNAKSAAQFLTFF